MTPLEMAKKKIAIRTCQNCGNMEIIDGVAYCKESGKLIHPMLLNGQTKCPHDVKGVKTYETDREKVMMGLKCLTHVDDVVYKRECLERGCPYMNTDCEIAVMEDAYNLLTQMKNYDHLLHLAKAMHTWIFLHVADEQAVYDELGFTDEDNALLGSIGRPIVIGTVKREDCDE